MKSEPLLSSLTTRVVMKLVLRAEYPVRTGPAEEGEALRRLLRLSDGRLILLGTSLKGAFRSLAEAIAKGSEFEKLQIEEPYRTALDAHSERERAIVHLTREVEGRVKPLFASRRREIEALAKMLRYDLELPEDRRAVEELYLAIHCPIDALFGSPSVTGKLRVCDAILGGSIEFRPHVGINRARGVREERALFADEVLCPGTELPFLLWADNLKPEAYDSLLLAATLEAVAKLGLQVGGGKSTGHGLLRLDEEASEFYVIEFGKLPTCEDIVKAISNPMSEEFRVSLGELIEWLRGS